MFRRFPPVAQVLVVSGLLAASADAAVVRSGSAADIAGLQAVVDIFRDDLGELNPPEPGSVGEGRREINWDAAPDAVSAPNPFPPDFFNFPAFPRARGVIFETPGTGFQLSATAASGVGIEFSNLDASFDETFDFFSPERLFTALGSNVVDVVFKVPGTEHDALSTGFGAVFTDVDLEETTSIEYFDRWGGSLGRWYVPAAATWGEHETFSFLGVSFDDAVVARVRIVNGNYAVTDGLTEASAGVDLVVMDDFIYGEPIPADPVPGDTDGDGLVDFVDLLNVLSEWGPCPGCPEDLDGDGSVGFSDLLIVLSNFG